MEKVKIISNPYNKEIKIEILDREEEKWNNINLTNPKSKLLNKKYISGFLPFIINDIIEIIWDEYHTGSEQVNVIFEGNSDEYCEVEKVCNSSEFKDKIVLSQSKRYLENAREIQPVITNVFSENIYPIVIQSEDIQSEEDYKNVQKDESKYKDAITDTIPICVLGNYSAGKSTFINSLIGKEILPSGAKPTTAKIHKIFESNEENIATISFEVNDDLVKIIIEKDTFKIEEGNLENTFVKKIKEELDSLENKNTFSLANKALEIINCYSPDDEEVKISSCIEIHIPFAKGPLSESKKKFVIFDTPGSNSASNEEHSKVLKEALKGFSNGLPIFVSHYDSLDSTDNEALYKDIRDIEALDNRFTLIVVNKADEAGLSPKGFSNSDRDTILSESVPKNLYSSGIYFVSSIVGLGYKNKGEFLDNHSMEIFSEKETKYKDESSNFYKELYKYNIIPKQQDVLGDKGTQNVDLVYLNSGLYSVELAILNFAEKYSGYDKCKQSKLFLDSMVDSTQKAISNHTKKCEEEKRKLEEDLEKSKKQIIQEIDNTEQENYMRFNNEFEAKIVEVKYDKSITYEELEKKQKEYFDEIAEEKNLSMYQEKLDKSKKKIGNNLKSNFAEFKNGKNIKDFFSNIGNVAKDAIEDTKGRFDSSGELDKEKDKIKDESIEKLKQYMIDEISNKLDEKENFANNLSKTFWDEKCEEFRNSLKETIFKFESIDDNKKQELEKIIVDFENIDLINPSNEIFKDNGLKIFDEIFSRRFRKYADIYNKELENNINELRETVKESHKQSFTEWKNKLVALVKNNILSYSPVLVKQQQRIDEEAAKIEKFKAKEAKLKNYSYQINKMVDWKEN